MKRIRIAWYGIMLAYLSFEIVRLIFTLNGTIPKSPAVSAGYIVALASWAMVQTLSAHWSGKTVDLALESARKSNELADVAIHTMASQGEDWKHGEK